MEWIDSHKKHKKAQKISTVMSCIEAVRGDQLKVSQHNGIAEIQR